MRILGRGRSRFRYHKLAVGELINYVTGFSPVPIPLSILAQIWEEQKRRLPAYFVDWALDDWPLIYNGELSETLRIHYKGQLWHLPQVLYFDNTQRQLPLSQFHLQLDSDCPVFLLPESVRAFTQPAFEKLSRKLERRSQENKKRTGKASYWDGKNLRLIGVESRDDGNHALVTQVVSYYDYVRSNLVLDAECDKKRGALRHRLHSFVEGHVPDGMLELLNAAPLANNLGINILLFTADGLLITQMRSKGVAFRSDELCPAASGTIDVADLDEQVFSGLRLVEGGAGEAHDIRQALASYDIATVADHLQMQDKHLLATPAPLSRPVSARTTRELTEEMKILYSDLQRLEFLGITRELIRGGEPELFFEATSRLSRKDVVSRWKNADDRWESKGLEAFDFQLDPCDTSLSHPQKIHLLERTNVFLERYVEHGIRRPSAGVTLLANVALWLRCRLGCEWYDHARSKPNHDCGQ